MFNHVCHICSKIVFMENANFMIFLTYGLSYIVFSFLYMMAIFISLKMKQLLIIYV